MGVHVPKLLSCWYFWPPCTIKCALQKWQHEIVWPNYRTKWQKIAIGPQLGYILSDWKPRYRWFDEGWCTCDDYDIAVEKLRRIWKFWFYLSLCENAMGCKHKLNNQHNHFHSLAHILAGLYANHHPGVQVQELLHITWCWRLTQHRKIYHKSTKPQQNDPLADTQTAEEAHRALQ